MRRGTSRDAAHLMRGIIANHDERAHTAHDIATETPDRDQLPDRVRSLLDRRAAAVHARRLVTAAVVPKPMSECFNTSSGSNSTSAEAKTTDLSTASISSPKFPLMG